MNRLDIKGILREVGFKPDRIADTSFGRPTPLPYAVYIYGGSSPFCADDGILSQTQNITVEVYTDMRRDQELIDRVSEALKGRGIIFETAEDYIESEKTYRVSFYFEEMI